MLNVENRDLGEAFAGTLRASFGGVRSRRDGKRTPARAIATRPAGTWSMWGVVEIAALMLGFDAHRKEALPAKQVDVRPVSRTSAGIADAARMMRVLPRAVARLLAVAMGRSYRMAERCQEGTASSTTRVAMRVNASAAEQAIRSRLLS